MHPVPKIFILISLVGVSLASIEKYQFKFGIQDRGRVVEKKTGVLYSATVKQSVVFIDFPEHIYGGIVNIVSDKLTPTVGYKNNTVVITYEYTPKPANVREGAQQKVVEYEVIVHGTEWVRNVASN